VNLRSGRWLDLATGREGSNLVMLATLVWRVTRQDAAVRLAKFLRIDPYR